MREKGFLLLETILTGAILLAAASVCLVFGAAERQLLHNEAAVTAAFLGKEQLARAESRPKSTLLAESSLPWLGKGENPHRLNGREFLVDTAVLPSADVRFREVVVRVAWEENGRQVIQEHRKLVNCYEP